MRQLTPIRAALIALALAACQTAPTTTAPTVAGTWESIDAQPPFRTTFSEGRFATRLVANDETVADGQYTPTPEGVTLNWVSAASGEARSGQCVFTTERNMRCTPSVGNAFTMSRVA